MDVKQKKLFLLTLLILFNPDYGSAQVSFDSLFLNPDCTDSISCRISFTMADKFYQRIKDSRGIKYRCPDAQMIYNNMSIPVRSLDIRGKSTLNYTKKSFTLKLDKNIDLNNTR